MKISIKILLTVWAAMMLAACSGGTALGLFPVPKSLNGEVVNGVYVSPSKKFSVQIPYPPDRSQDDAYEWRYAKVSEISDGPVEGVIFGPAAFDRNVYHAVLVSSAMDSDKQAYAADVFSRKIESRNGSYKKEDEGIFSINNQDVFYAIYSTRDWFTVLTITDNGKSFYAVEADIQRGSIASPSIESLKAREWGRLNNVLSTFTVKKI